MRLAELRVLALDCQAGGATPAHGDLLELGWALSGPEGVNALEQAAAGRCARADVVPTGCPAPSG